MPRPPRIHVEGALYYVTSRALEPNALFRDRSDYETYLDLLKGYQEQFGFKLFAYVLLPDQLHLCLELTGPTTISAIMHALTSRYTKYVNKRYGHAGHLFQERFKSTLLEKGLWLLRLTGYLHTLPQRCGKGPGIRYPLKGYLDCNKVSDTGRLGGEVREVLEHLSRQYPNMSYEQYVASIPLSEWEAVSGELHHPVVGSPAFVALAQNRAQQAAHRSIEPAQPAPQPSGPRRATRPVLTGSLAVAFASLCVTVLYARNVSALRQTVQVLAQERTLASVSAEQQPHSSEPASATTATAATATLANLTRPSNLAGTTWHVQIKPMYAGGETQIQSDELRFDGGKVVSSVLAAQGFSGSNYSLSVQPTGAVQWETMQTGPNNEVICWRGEWDGKTMRGVLTRQVPGQVASNFAFIGTEPQRRDTKET